MILQKDTVLFSYGFDPSNYSLDYCFHYATRGRTPSSQYVKFIYVPENETKYCYTHFVYNDTIHDGLFINQARSDLDYLLMSEHNNIPILVPNPKYPAFHTHSNLYYVLLHLESRKRIVVTALHYTRYFITSCDTKHTQDGVKEIWSEL